MLFKISSILLAVSLPAVSQNITTLAGNGAAGFSGDNGPAAQAQINRVVGLAVDAAGNVYLADENNHRVRKVDTGGTITTLAGTGAAGFSGDNGPAQQAQLNHPTGVCVSPQGDVYVNDQANFRVRKISTSGTITTVAGNGSNVHSGDGGPGPQAGMVIPIRCAVDRSGNLYIADQGASRVRKVDTGGIISTFAGNGAFTFSGDAGPAAAAGMNNPTAVATDSGGNVWITDQFNHRIRKVDSGGTITTVAGNGTNAYGGDGGPATSASFSFPGSIVVDSAGALYLVDSVANRIRKVSGGVINTIAGTGAPGFGGDGAPALQALFNAPFAIAQDISGALYIGDTSNNRVRVISGGAAPTPPTLDAGSLANGATYVSGGLVSGSWAQVKGSNISPLTRIWGDADFAGLGNNLPTTLSGIGVKVNGVAAAVYFISATQVSFQVPAGITGTATVQVTRNGVASSTVTAQSASSSPGIFPIIVGGRNFPAGVFADGKFTGDPALNPAFRKARAGDVVQLFATGLQAAPAGTLVSTTPVSGVTVTVGSVTVPADFAGLVGVGLFQVNFTVPSLATGDYPITITVNGQSSPATINSTPPAPLTIPIA